MADSLFGAVVVKRVRDAVVLNIRDMFRTDVSYPYIDNNDGSLNFDQTKISINDVTPLDHLFYPSIIVSTVAGEESRFIQEDYLSSTVNADGSITELRGAPINFSVLIQSQALDTVVRDELLDKIYDHFKMITDDLAANGVAIIKTFLESDKREFVQDRWIYTSGVRMSLYAEWLDSEVTAVSGTLREITGKISTPTVSQNFRL